MDAAFIWTIVRAAMVPTAKAILQMSRRSSRSAHAFRWYSHRIERALARVISEHELFREDHVLFPEEQAMFREEHSMFRDEHKKLLTAQVVLTDRMDKLTVKMTELADAQKHTDERIGVLITMMDGFIRGGKKA